MCVFYVLKHNVEMPLQLLNHVFADNGFVYGFSNGNSQAAKHDYQRIFPNRIEHHHKTFSLVFHNLQSNHLFSTVACCTEHPVSYTHLDVYKRQVIRCLIKMCML